MNTPSPAPSHRPDYAPENRSARAGKIVAVSVFVLLLLGALRLTAGGLLALDPLALGPDGSLTFGLLELLLLALGLLGLGASGLVGLLASLVLLGATTVLARLGALLLALTARRLLGLGT